MFTLVLCLLVLALGALVLALVAHRGGRRAPVTLALVVCSLMFGQAAFALPGLFDTWTATGNGRGGQLAARPTCNNTYRGRPFALYGASASVSDVQQVCLFSTAGGGTYVWKGVDTTAGGT